MNRNTDIMRPQQPWPQTAAPTMPPARPRPRFAPRPAPARQPNLWHKIQFPLLITAGAMAGFFADNLVFGLVLLTAYAVVALVTRIASRTTFTLALLLLAAISLLLLFKPNQQLIRHFATYAFVLLLIGVITLGREVKLPKRTRRAYRR